MGSLFSKNPDVPRIEKNKKNIEKIFKTLDKKSALKNFAFYNLYPETKEGKLALKKAWEILGAEKVDNPHILPKIDINLMIDLVNKKSSIIPEDLTFEKLDFLSELGKNLKNRKLKGYNVWTLEEVRNLTVAEIDLSRALFLEDLGEAEDAIYKIKYYEVILDLMTLQILAKLPDNFNDIDILNAMNEYIFHDLRFRYPPHSVDVAQIDKFTFLSSVMDSRRGVCLGVSTLYLVLSQRLGINLEIVTPPGHIFVRYKDSEGKITNIETTARGVNYPSEVYLGIDTKKLKMANIKEVVGHAFINQASLFWNKKDYETAINLYKKAKIYVINDNELNYFMGLNYLFLNKQEEAREILQNLKNYKDEYSTSKDTIIDDYLNNNTDAESIKKIFMSVDESRKSIIEKQKELSEVLKKYPKFRAGMMQLANTYLQLGREKEAFNILEKYFEIDREDPVLNYYLSAISFQRYDYLNSWKYFKNTKKILDKQNHNPHAMKELYNALKIKCPEKSI
ncbi:MAG: hypothetical protein A3F40_03765 [Chlamydiae bacterium RIFCSPHIGHO2_12_FULL_27_8]|nr:MAG: hypothetical protein A3F40_03765 [Chlamydiae bacterium RIFCSPHIGHO2_12_FULL_27_8]OGN65202.1 MAG: hypothetical protein A2888_01370 [Chlamydiae bacterium RIFCSPLOWO2_01_FULL_28_7]